VFSAADHSETLEALAGWVKQTGPPRIPENVDDAVSCRSILGAFKDPATAIGSRGSPNPTQEEPMKLIRIVFFGLAVLLPTAWTIAQAADAPAGDAAKKEKKGSKEGAGDTKSEKKP
jgi:hypothetical protein